MGTKDDLGHHDPIVYIQDRCDKAGEEHRDGSNVGSVRIVREFCMPESPPVFVSHT